MEQKQNTTTQNPQKTDGETLTSSFNAASEAYAYLHGVIFDFPLSLVTGGLTLPWLMGREAGIGAYKIENGLDEGGYSSPILAGFDANTIEGQSWRGFLKNAWNEAKGLGKSLIPFAISLPLSLAAGLALVDGVQDQEIHFAALTGTMFLLTLGTHLIGGTYMSRKHSKNVLAPHYAQKLEAYQQQAPKAPTNTL